MSEERFSRLEEMIENISLEITYLKTNMNKRFDHVDAELAKINNVTAYDGKVKNMKIIDDREEA